MHTLQYTGGMACIGYLVTNTVVVTVLDTTRQRVVGVEEARRRQRGFGSPIKNSPKYGHSNRAWPLAPALASLAPASASGGRPGRPWVAGHDSEPSEPSGYLARRTRVLLCTPTQPCDRAARQRALRRRRRRRAPS